MADGASLAEKPTMVATAGAHSAGESKQSITPGPTLANEPQAPALPEHDTNVSAAKDASPLPPNAHTQSLAKPAIESASRFSWRSLSFLVSKARGIHKAQLSAAQEQVKKHQAASDYTLRELKLSRSERRARQSAEVLRSLIVGSSAISSSQVKSKPISKRKLERVKSELINPRSANKVIAQLRAMSPSDHVMVAGLRLDDNVSKLPSGPIHAVCLAYTDADAHEQHFSKLKGGNPDTPASTKAEESFSITSAMVSVADITNASITQITALFSELHIVSLITAPDLGIGQPGDGPGLLSGSVPTADTVLQGVEQITPQLMALGYATGKAILPDHSNIYPPTDRMSVITYWWGFEVVLPPSSIKYLSNVPSIAHAVINFLTGLSLVNGGVREILPFVRYISQYIDAEFNMIKYNNKGMGVVCAATWIMPAALVPRPWDFPQPPLKPGGDNTTGSPDEKRPSTSPSTSRPSSPTLSPPLPPLNHMPVFVTPNAALPVDETPVELDGVLTERVPEVKVIPPTPPAAETLRGISKDLGTEMQIHAQGVETSA